MTTPGMALVPANFYANQARYMLNYGASLRTHRLRNITGGTTRAQAFRRSAFARANYRTYKMGKGARSAIYKGFNTKAGRKFYRTPFYINKFRYKYGAQANRALINAMIKHPKATQYAVMAGFYGTTYYVGNRLGKRLGGALGRRLAARKGMYQRKVVVQRKYLPGRKVFRQFETRKVPAGKLFGHQMYANQAVFHKIEPRAPRRKHRSAQAAHGYKNKPPELTTAQRRQIAKRRRRVRGRFA